MLVSYFKTTGIPDSLEKPITVTDTPRHRLDSNTKPTEMFFRNINIKITNSKHNICRPTICLTK